MTRWRRLLACYLGVGVVAAGTACGATTPSVSSAESTSAAPVRDATSPEQVVGELGRALEAGDLAAATQLTVDGQMVIVALAEGVTIREALMLEEAGADQVGANFWSGFSEGLEDFLGRRPADLRIGESARFDVDGHDFARVAVTIPLDGTSRHFVLKRETDGWRVDVIATFASALAGKLADGAEFVRDNPQGEPLLGLMREQVPSLEAVLEEPGIGPELQQAVIAAIAAITR